MPRVPSKPRGESRRSLSAANQLAMGWDFGKLIFNPILWFVGTTLALILTAQHLGQQYAASWFPLTDFRWEPEQITVNPAESWPEFQPAQDIYQQAALAQVSYLEPRLLLDVAAAAEALPYVEQVQRLEKARDRLELQLQYRSPRALVAVDGAAGQRVKLVVDRRGVLLPKTPQAPECAALMTLFLFQPQTQGLTEWKPWPDPRVQEGVEVIEQVGTQVAEWGLIWVVTAKWSGTDNQPYELWTANQGKVIWSDDPRDETKESVQRKLAALREWVRLNGSIDQLAGWKKLDVRGSVPQLIDENGKVAEADESHWPAVWK